MEANNNDVGTSKPIQVFIIGQGRLITINIKACLGNVISTPNMLIEEKKGDKYTHVLSNKTIENPSHDSKD